MKTMWSSPGISSRRRRGATSWSFVVGMTAALALPGCGGDSESSGGEPAGSAPAAPAGASGQTLVIKDFKFQPATLQVRPGAKILVRNEDDSVHTVTADDGSLDTGNIDGMAQKELTAPPSGRVRYKCDIHQYMTGVIQVGTP
jgi:plastocyanin